MALPTVEAFERAGLAAWPGTDVHWDGSWVRRAAGGYTKRANSVQCLDPEDGEDADLRVISASTWMVVRRIKPVFRITPLAAPELVETLDDAGWQSIDESHLFAMELGAQQADPEAKLLPVLDPAFLAVQRQLQNYSDATMAGMQALLAAFVVPATGIVVYRDGAPVASGLMAIADGIVITGNVVTDPSRRRQGLGAAMMRSGLEWARGKGATVAALNVQADNPGAQALYEGLGYRHQYDYSYRIPGAQ
ncbi:Acetyltransferase (GNAT) family protein [Devosia sp. YR412]|uniref:GNAT family N-acetyltransferase n=1 Tax=Devosia sp. YR412 TaxID=1881030 RepID=UPI0008C2A17E|nr:GNAT family N-acetyltransferase [Devosia sp. YR412]SEQ30249.1 Acetyltransferase (GNAT) family protein [Devosia sp. YR412]